MELCKKYGDIEKFTFNQAMDGIIEGVEKNTR